MVQLWIDLVKESLQSVDATLPEDFDFSSLAHVSMGFSCGAIVRAVKSTLTARRLYRVRERFEGVVHLLCDFGMLRACLGLNWSSNASRSCGCSANVWILLAFLHARSFFVGFAYLRM